MILGIQIMKKDFILGLSAVARLLVVCHCSRHKDSIIRIISARKATKNESMQY
jgi:uncharacterized DUF497 family protein